MTPNLSKSYLEESLHEMKYIGDFLCFAANQVIVAKDKGAAVNMTCEI
jgi:hypothetical protein